MITAIINAHLVLPPDSPTTAIRALRFDTRQILSFDRPPQRGDRVLDAQGWMLYPGLINAHDHLELNHYPRTKFRERYDNAHQWGEDFLPHLEAEPFASLRRLSLGEQCRSGGEKNLRAGVTTVAQHNPLHRPLRRRDFPVRVVQHYGWTHSLHFGQAIAQSYRRTPKHYPWMIHLAEGTDAIAAGELAALDGMGCLGANTVFIHGVGFSAADRQRALAAQAALVWCPSSNAFLLGATAQVSAFAQAGKLALGSDSRLTADGDLLDELRAASKTGQIDAAALFRAVTTDAARLLRLSHVGALLPRYQPDFFLAPPPSNPDQTPYQALIDLRPEQIRAVFIGGVLRLGRWLD